MSRNNEIRRGASAVRRALELVGSGTVLARVLGVTPTLVYAWANGRKRVAAKRVLAIEEATSYMVSRHDIRPDLYPREPWCACPDCTRRAARARVRS